MSLHSEDLLHARGLPNRAFTDDTFYHREIEQLHSARWVSIGFCSDVPEIGDVYPTDFAGLPLLILRDRNNKVRVFHNVCPHRGMRVVREPGRKKRSLTCPYHCWTYDLDGTLRRRPYFNGPDDAEGDLRETEDVPKLSEVRVAIWLDSIFVNLNGEAPPFEDYAKDFLQIASEYGGCEEAKREGTVDFDMACNWKIVAENFIDSYHLPWIHPKTLEPSTPMITYWHEVKGNICIGRSPIESNRPGWGSTGMPQWQGLQEAVSSRLTFVSLFPNTLINFTPTRFSFFILNPVAPDRTLERIAYYMPQLDNPITNAEREEFKQIYIELNSEDQWVVEELQRSRVSSGFDGGRFSPHWDKNTHYFSRLVAEAMEID